MNFREEIKIIWEERTKPRITLPKPTGNRVLDANKLRRFLNVNRGRVGSVLSAAAAAGRHGIVNQILSTGLNAKAQTRAGLNANAQPIYLRMAKLLGEVRVGLRFDPLRPRRSDG